MKKIMTLLLTFAMTMMLIACTDGGTEPADTAAVPEAGEETAAPETQADAGDEKVLIGAIYRDLTQTWFEKESTAAKATADELGIDILIGDGQEDPAVLIDVLDSFITQGIQGLVINTCDQGLSQTILDKCEAAGIPVVAVDVPLIDDAGNHIAPAVILDSYLCGQQTVEWLLNHVEENGGMGDADKTGMLILAMETVTSCIPRADGQYDYFTENVPDFPAENIWRVDYGAGSSDDGYNAAAATITAHPEIETWYVVAANDEGVVGAARFLEEIGLDENAVCVGIDGYLAADEFKKEASCVKASAYLDSGTVAEVSVTALYENIINGTEIFGEYKGEGEEFGTYPFGSVIVTKDNYQEIMGDAAN